MSLQAARSREEAGEEDSQEDVSRAEEVVSQEGREEVVGLAQAQVGFSSCPAPLFSSFCCWPSRWWWV